MIYQQLRTSAILAVFLGALSTASLQAQNRIAVEVEKPAFEALQSPEFAGTKSKSWDKKDWLEMEVEFEVTKVDPSSAAFVDNLTVKWYVAAEDPETRKFVLLEKVVEHINVPVGEEIYSSVYLAPSAVKRLSGGDRASEGVIAKVGGEILFNGQKVAAFSSDGKVSGTPWWQSPSLSRYNKVPLRAKHETPFQYFWWDRFAENKVEQR